MGAWAKGAALAAMALACAMASAQQKALIPSGKALGDSLFEARGEGPGAKVALWARNGSASPMVEAQALAIGLDKQGREVFEARAQWRGRLEPGARAPLAAAMFEMPGLPQVASLRVEPLMARYEDGKTAGAWAPWGLRRDQERDAMAFLRPALSRDAQRSKAFSAAKPTPVEAAAGLWAPAGNNPYDPSSGLWVAFAWRAQKPERIRGSKATFYQTGAGPMFFKSAIEAPRDLGAGAESFAWIGVRFPQMSKAQAAAFERAARGHGVDVERVYGKEEAPSH